MMNTKELVKRFLHKIQWIQEMANELKHIYDNNCIIYNCL
jgi:hypothetical protein